MKHTLLILDWEVAQCVDTPADGAYPELGALAFIQAKVPRSVHYDLMEAGLLDRFLADKEAVKQAQWVSRADWVYRAAFALSPQMLGEDVLRICFDCVDTFSDVFINGTYIGSTDNMFEPWAFTLPKEILRPLNELVVHVKGHRRMVEYLAEENVRRIGCYNNDEWSKERTLVRRYQRSYNTDFLDCGIALQGIGLLRPAYVTAFSLPAIRECTFAVLQADPNSAQVEITVTVDAPAGGALRAEGSLSCAGAEDHVFSAQIDGEQVKISLTLIRPRLWWPRGSGQQTLYDLKLRLLAGGRLADSVNRKVGIRKPELRLQTKSGRQDFQFVLNGREIYLKGANWIPIDFLNAGGTREQCLHLLRMAAHANMNMLRLWGGGTEEPDWFYSYCDELGIMIWQDAHMHSHTYPDYLDAFVNAVREETIHMITRLRSHPCFVIICGGNEQQEGWDTWNWQAMHERFFGGKLIYDVLKKAAEEHCPEIPYISNSPYGAKNSQSPVDGDTHTWGNYYNATEDPLFVTETCWYSGTLSKPETFLELAQLNVDDYAGLRWHERWVARTGQQLYHVNQYSEYHKVTSLREYIYGLEIEQLRADYAGLYYLRTRSPSCKGILYWPLNKGGLMMNYGCIDPAGRALMPYSLLQRLFADVVIHAYRDGGDIRVVAANDGDETDGELALTHMRTDGHVLLEETRAVTIPSGNYRRLMDLPGLYHAVQNRWREIVYVRLIVAGKTISEDCVYFCPFSEVEIEDGQIHATLTKQAEGEWGLTLVSTAFAKLIDVTADTGILYSDNHFSLLPREEKTIRINAYDLSIQSLTLRIQSLDCQSTVTVCDGQNV